MENKNVNQNRDFSSRNEPKKGIAGKIGEKMERLGDKISRKAENTKEHFRESQR